MFSYIIYLNTCLAALLFSVATCEGVIYKCKDSGDFSSSTCTIDNANYTKSTKFQLEGDRHDYVILKFTNSRISDIPQGIFLDQRYLNWIDFSNCHVLEVSDLAFHEASKLIGIDLSHNDLAILRNRIFWDAYLVEEINLSYNKITEMESFTFQHLGNLKRINLSNNQIKKMESTVFWYSEKLSNIDLSVNLIESIAVDLHTYLMELDLSENFIVTVDQRAFKNTKLLKMLNLNYNRVKNLRLVDVRINIETIRIAHNNLTVLQTNNNLRVLDAANNQLTSANLIMGLNISNLSLSNNLLNNLDFIKPLSKLKQLDVSYNRIGDHLVNLDKIDFQMFGEFQLSFLDISYNGLKSINFETLSFLENLSHLFIDGNRLTQLPFERIGILFPKLKTIAISANSWMCTDLFAMLTYFRRIHIQIYIDDAQLVKNETNIGGIKCTDDQNNTSIGNHDAIKNNYMSEINQACILLNSLQMENEQLKFDLNQIGSILDNITNTNSNLIVIKILLIGFFVIGVVFGALKLYQTLLYGRSNRHSYNTMEDVINENNI